MVKTTTLCTCLLIFSLFLTPDPIMAQDLLYEDFEDGIAEAFQPQDSFWEVSEGVYQCNVEGYEYLSKSIAGDGSWSDYSFECDLQVEGAFSQIVLVRLVDPDNFYQIDVRGEPWNDANLFKWVDGVQQHLLTVNYNSTTGVWHHYRIDLWQNQIRVEFDGEEIFTVEDTSDPFLYGGIGLAGYTGGVIQWQQAKFDNVIVSTITSSTENNTWGELKALYR